MGASYHVIWDYTKDANGNIPVQFCKDSNVDLYFVNVNGFPKDGEFYDNLDEAYAVLNKVIKEEVKKRTA